MSAKKIPKTYFCSDHEENQRCSHISSYVRGTQRLTERTSTHTSPHSFLNFSGCFGPHSRISGQRRTTASAKKGKGTPSLLIAVNAARKYRGPPKPFVLLHHEFSFIHPDSPNHVHKLTRNDLNRLPPIPLPPTRILEHLSKPTVRAVPDVQPGNLNHDPF